MSNPFFDHPILNSPYECPMRYWELDETGQPTQKIIERRRSAKFITPIPKPKKRKAAAQSGFVFDEGKGLSTKGQQYDTLWTPPAQGDLFGVGGVECTNLSGLLLERSCPWP